MSDEKRGLYRKYSVRRLRDRSGKHRNCEYFVIDWAHDPFAIPAMEAYAAACAEEHPKLAFDLRHKIAAWKRIRGRERVVVTGELVVILGNCTQVRADAMHGGIQTSVEKRAVRIILTAEQLAKLYGDPTETRNDVIDVVLNVTGAPE